MERFFAWAARSRRLARDYERLATTLSIWTGWLVDSDKAIRLLQGRLFSYLDKQLSRLGTSNFNQLPITAPKYPFSHHQRDGKMQMAQPVGRLAYERNLLWGSSPRENPVTGIRSAAVTELGEKSRIRPESFADHYSHARQFLIRQNVHEQAHVASAVLFELSNVKHPHIRGAMVGHLRHIPDAPKAAAPVKHMKASPALQIIGKMKATLHGWAVGILIANGSDGAAIKKIKKVATDAGVAVKLIAPKIGGAKLADGSMLTVDGQPAGTPSVLFDAVAVILSDARAKELAKESAAIDFVRDAFGHLKAIATEPGSQAFLNAANVGRDGDWHRQHQREHRAALIRNRCSTSGANPEIRSGGGDAELPVVSRVEWQTGETSRALEDRLRFRAKAQFVAGPISAGDSCIARRLPVATKDGP